jgi:hypothetical protein
MPDPDDYDHYDNDPRDDDEEDGDDFDCGLMPDGQCLLAGSEQCDFDCPNRNSELFCGSRAWCKKHGVKYDP